MSFYKLHQNVVIKTDKKVHTKKRKGGERRKGDEKKERNIRGSTKIKR